MFLQVAPKPEWWDRFFACVYRIDRQDRGNGCWIWTGPWDDFGYGFFAINHIAADGKRTACTRAHRFIIEQYRGKIPRGLVVLHSCDTPQCVNPFHLSIGTIKDNVTDRDSKHRRIIKLNVEKAREILEFRGSDISPAEVAEAYGVSPTLIKNIWRGRMWHRAHQTAAIAAEIAKT